MKNKVISILLAAAMICTLTAPVFAAENESETTSEELEPATISIMTRYGDDTDVNAATFRKSLAAFQEEHPEITIEDLSITDETQYNNLFKTQMATGDVPTIFMTYGGGNLQSYVENGIAEDITPYLEADSEWYDSFNSTMFSMLTFEGIEGVYAVPYAAYVDSLFVNTALFEEYGIEIPTTIEELETACDQFL